jgi:hypothetical protein
MYTGPVGCMCIVVVVVVILKQGIYDQVAQRVWLTFINILAAAFLEVARHFVRCGKFMLPNI